MNEKVVAIIGSLLLGWMIASGDALSVPMTHRSSATSRNSIVQRRQSVASLVARSSNGDESDDDNGEVPIVQTSDVVKKVAVTGATGKTGRLVVQELLRRNVEVVGLVRNETKAAEVLVFGNYGDGDTDESSIDKTNSMLEVKSCDLSDPAAIATAIVGCDATIWCATGFSSAPTDANGGMLPPTATMSPEQSIDVIGVPAVARAMLEAQRSKAEDEDEQTACPRVVMLSSAGTTRPDWGKDKKEKLKGCADIPIVRLNPFGILGLKALSETKLRETGVNYCIVRPCGLNDDEKWPSGARPVFSQGDVAVGRINRSDVARVLCDVLGLPESCNKTFEVIGLGGYPPPRTIGPALERLRGDSEPPLSDVEVEAMYTMCQQLLPGERQDAAALAMGQTYEQLDKGETGRLGERGKENVGAAGIKPTAATATATTQA
eukprot:CAMPEP_0172373324 /NCGR_PEP_ID=MMETSP1060-20121228/51164_1 /TAXON_ID=37318 /ORGANISM="Pseudo-nitzschia pungens, Strain cf. cingulata" /LENGTH=433 /DNA_ID=CAMNT_0013099625 /DNA_START=182 /DNA_END=1483 /DNA_ORIENTATION=-